MKPVTRRVFLKRAVSGVGGIMLAKSLGPNVSLAQQPPADMSRVVVAEHTEATDGVRVINAANVQAMMDESIKQLTGEPSVADAWAGLLPDFRKDHLIAIKVNTTWFVRTHTEVVDAMVTGLTAAGVPENNIIIYDIATQGMHGLVQAGYKYNKSDVGVQCFGTFKSSVIKGGFMDGKAAVPEEGWGPDWDNPVDILGREMALSTILTRCDHLINVPVLKAHIWNHTAVSLSLKNHFGSVGDPPGLHANYATACATLNSQEAIKGKTRLVVIDGLFGAWSDQTVPPQFAPNSLIVTRDPVAADYIGTEMINEERSKYKQPPRNVSLLLQKAAELGVGTNDPEKMELTKVEMGPPKEEEEKPEEDDGKAVEPNHSYRTQWGHIRTAH
jgi:hypothetical protein